MPRNISFALTTEQFRNQTKTVTRRVGWKNAKAGDILMGCEKCMGLKPGEKLTRLGLIEVVDVRRESLDVIRYQSGDVTKEGFPELEGSPWLFIEMFCREMKCLPSAQVTRIEFRYL